MSLDEDGSGYESPSQSTSITDLDTMSFLALVMVFGSGIAYAIWMPQFAFLGAFYASYGYIVTQAGVIGSLLLAPFGALQMYIGYGLYRGDTRFWSPAIMAALIGLVFSVSMLLLVGLNEIWMVFAVISMGRYYIFISGANVAALILLQTEAAKRSFAEPSE